MDTEGETETQIHRFSSTMVFLPTPKEDDVLCYDMEVKPKSSHASSVAEYTVVKLWRDQGSGRPKSIDVDIYHEGNHWKTVTLSQDNQWAYTWTTTDLYARWSVTEKHVADGYTVSISQGENTFTIVNTATVPPEEPPKTGDTVSLWVYVLSLSFSGMMLLILGIWKQRRLA